MARAEGQARAGVHMTKRGAADAAFMAAGFFAGRLMAFGGLNPAAAAFALPYFGRGRRFYAAAAFVALGAATKFQYDYSVKYLYALAALCLLNPLATRFIGEGREVGKAALAAGVVALCAFIAPKPVSIGAYFLFITLMEAAPAFALGIVAQMAAGAATGRREISTESAVSLLIIGGVLAAGAADIAIGFLSLKYLLCSLLVLAAAQGGGAALGGCAGLAAGLLVNLCGLEGAEFPVVLGVCGLAAGLTRGGGKPFVALGFVLGAAMAIFYAGPGYFTWAMGASVLPACALFLFTPARLLDALRFEPAGVRHHGEPHGRLVKQAAEERLNGLARALSRLAQSMRATDTPKLSPRDAQRLVDDITEQACADCEMAAACWENDYLSTCRALYDMLEKREAGDETPAAFDAICTRGERFREAVEACEARRRAEGAWRGKLAEQRGALAREVDGLSGALSRLAADLDTELAFKPDLERRLAEGLARRDMEVDCVMVLANKRGRLEARLWKRGAWPPGFAAEAERAAGDILKRAMRAQAPDSAHYIRLTEAQRFCVTYGLARSAKRASGSGDCYSFLEYRDGLCLMALSDGMGSGKAARRESEAAIGLLEDFAAAGLDNETAARLINSALFLRGGGEAFSTLDVCCLDLHSGEADFLKLGAAATFLLRGGEIEALPSRALPVGILEEAEPDMARRAFRHGDVIVMLTDGVADAGGAEGWVIEHLRAHPARDPQRIADQLLAAAATAGASDDMTVLAAKVWDKNR